MRQAGWGVLGAFAILLGVGCASTHRTAGDGAVRSVRIQVEPGGAMGGRRFLVYRSLDGPRGAFVCLTPAPLAMSGGAPTGWVDESVPVGRNVAYFVLVETAEGSWRRLGHVTTVASEGVGSP